MRMLIFHLEGKKTGLQNDVQANHSFVTATKKLINFKS